MLERAELQQCVIRQALQQGFTDCEVFYLGKESFEVLLMEGEISSFENSREQGLAFRGNYQGRTGYAYTEELNESAIAFLSEEAKTNALLHAAEEQEALFAGEEYPAFSGYAPELESLSVEQLIQLTRRMETAALNGAGDIAALDYCVLGMTKQEVAIANSEGLDIGYTRNFASGFVTAIAKRGAETKTGSAFWKGKSWADFDPEETGRRAAVRAAALLGAASVESGVYTVVLDGKAMAALVSAFCGIFYAENVHKGFSLLEGRLGEPIAAACVTLRDDALLEGGYASVPFDSEGVAGRNKAVIADGVLKTLLYNRKTALEDGVVSTGNGFKSGLSGSVKTACTNFYIQQGENDRRALLAMAGDGLLITDLMGLHAGTNAVSGEFSLSAEGFLITNGMLGRAVEQVTIAGNFYSLLQSIRAVGDDLYFTSTGKGSPSALVAGLDVAGAGMAGEAGAVKKARNEK